MPSTRVSSLPALFLAFGAAGCALALGAAVYAGTLVNAGSPLVTGPDRPSSSVASYPSRGAEPARSLPGASARSTGAGSALPASSLLSLRFPALFDPAEPHPRAIADVPDPAALAALMDRKASFLPILGNDQVVAFYGHPNSRRMGILGLYPKEELASMIERYAELYDEANGELGAVPAFYLIYGTCWPEGEIGYLSDAVVADYIEYARSRGMLVFVDHQIGKYGVEAAVRRLLPWLKYPNAHIALDPEWRTTAPMKEIGAITARELNEAQALVRDYMEEEGIPGTKMLVVHQFNAKMIADRDQVRADYDGVLLVHTSDGFGPPDLKRGAYSFNAKAGNMPLKGFKLFFKGEVEGAGFDEPILTPRQVLALEPRPMVIIYQ